MKTLISLLLLATSLSLAAQDPAPRQPEASEAPALHLQDLSGAPASVDSLRGQLVIVNFWATWCVPCKEEMPLLSSIANEYRQRGVTVLGANADDASTAKNIPKFLKRTPVTFPIWTGATTTDMLRFNLGTALPATAFLDRDGAVMFRVLGPLEAGEIRERLDYLLSDRTSAKPIALLNNLEKALQRHEEETGHQHGSISLEGASSVPS